jgi:hypothetical protein
VGCLFRKEGLSWGLGWGSSPEVATVVSHDVGVPASFQHENFLLKDGDIIICQDGTGRGSWWQGIKGRWSQDPRMWGWGRGRSSRVLSHQAPSSPSSMPPGPQTPCPEPYKGEVGHQAGSICLSPSASLSYGQGLGSSCTRSPS